MGNGIAHVFAQFGNHVTLIDRSEELLERGMSSIRRNMERQVEKGTLDRKSTRLNSSHT